MSKRGFTIIELLGVISVIAVLAAILFPVFARTREMARRQSCLSNLFNIGMALRMYALDNDGYYPPRDDDLGPLYPQYVGDKIVFTCPASSYQRQVPMGAPADESLPIESQHYNMGYGPMTPRPKESEDKAKPEEEPLKLSYYYRAGHRHNELPVAPLVTDHELCHMEKANVLFSDGSLRWVEEQEWRALGFRPLEEILAERNAPPGKGPLPRGFGPGMLPPGPPGMGPGMPPSPRGSPR